MEADRAREAREEAERRYPWTLTNWTGSYAPPADYPHPIRAAFVAGAEWRDAQVEPLLEAARAYRDAWVHDMALDADDDAGTVNDYAHEMWVRSGATQETRKAFFASLATFEAWAND